MLLLSLTDEEMGSSEESGKDWSELEEEAREADKNQTDYVDDSIRKKKNPLPKSRHDLKHRSPQKNGSSSMKRKSDDHRSSQSSKKFRK